MNKEEEENPNLWNPRIFLGAIGCCAVMIGLVASLMWLYNAGAEAWEMFRAISFIGSFAAICLASDYNKIKCYCENRSKDEKEWSPATHCAPTWRSSSNKRRRYTRS